jgi:hypothetical protein
MTSPSFIFVTFRTNGRQHFRCVLLLFASVLLDRATAPADTAGAPSLSGYLNLTDIQAADNAHPLATGERHSLLRDALSS